MITAIEAMELVVKLAAAVVDAVKTGKTHVDVNAIMAVGTSHTAAEKTAHDAAETELDTRFPR